MTKKQLIEKYENGTLVDYGYYNPSAFDVYCVVEFDEEYVFGFYQYMDNAKEFFKVKTKILNDSFSFKVGNRTINANNVLRCRF